MPSNVIVKPAETPVALVELKDYLRETLSSQDTVITSLITAATELFEGTTGRKLVTQTVEQTLDNFVSAIEIECLPVQSIVSIKYTDPGNTEQTLDPANYMLDKGSQDRSWITPAFGKSWPDTYTGRNGVRVQYEAGYGLATAVPEDIKQWIRAHTIEFFENRGVTHNTILTHPYLSRIVGKYRVY